MLYMVIERFKPGMKDAVYRRHAEHGRMLPVGLAYVDSWVEEGGNRCFQLMETEHRELFRSWVAKWSDLVDFEIVPVGDTPADRPAGRGDP